MSFEETLETLLSTASDKRHYGAEVEWIFLVPGEEENGIRVSLELGHLPLDEPLSEWAIICLAERVKSIVSEIIPEGIVVGGHFAPILEISERELLERETWRTNRT